MARLYLLIDFKSTKKNEDCASSFFFMAGEERIELSLMVLETTVLPLNYSPVTKGRLFGQPLYHSVFRISLRYQLPDQRQRFYHLHG